MSNSPKGILAYGYNLGSKETGWNFSLVDQPTIFSTAKVDFEKAERILLKGIVGFTETWDNRIDAAFHIREKTAKNKLGLEFIRYGSADYAGYILASTVHQSDDWGANIVEISLDHSAAHRLQVALDILGIIPGQREPKWILATYYG